MELPAAAPPRRWKNATLVRERDDRRVRWLWGWLLGIVAAFAPIAVYLLQQMEYVQVRYRIEALRAEQDRLSEEERRLRVERATLEALPRVDARATTELGLVHPPRQHVVVIRQRSTGQGSLPARVSGDGRIAR